MPSQKTGNPLTGKKKKKIAKLLFQTVIREILIHIKIGEWSSLTLVGVAADPSSPCPLICSVGSDGPSPESQGLPPAQTPLLVLGRLSGC